MASGLTWPNGKKVAVSVTVMFETWADDKAPTYSVQTTHLKSGTVDHAGKAWSTYGGRVGVWRIIRLLDRLGIPGTFCVNARCTEEYPEAVKQIVRSGHDIAGHAYTQDQLLAYMSLEQQESTIGRSIDLLQQCGGKTVTGWASPVVAFTPETPASLPRRGSFGRPTSLMPICRSKFRPRTARSPACQRRISPTTACCAPIRAISTTPTRAPSSTSWRTNPWGFWCS